MPSFFRPILILVLCWLILILAWGDPALASDLSTHLPAAGDLDVWAPVGQAQQYEGLDLYELINGGAEVYHEYGFRRVLAQEYGDQKQRYIAVEIYEMENPAAAFGIYSFKTGASGQSIPLPSEAILSGHYLNIWKGRFLVTLSGAEPDEATREGLVKLGKAVTDRITITGPRPELMNMLPVEPDAPAKVWYLAGDLVLSNLVSVDGLAPLGFAEGTAGDFGDLRLYLLGFPQQEQASVSFTSAVDRLAARGHSPLEMTSDLAPTLARFEVRNGETIHIELIRGFILVTVGKESTGAEMIRELLRSRLANLDDD